jgi:hypothetical protein
MEHMLSLWLSNRDVLVEDSYDSGIKVTDLQEVHFLASSTSSDIQDEVQSRVAHAGCLTKLIMGSHWAPAEFSPMDRASNTANYGN